MLQSLRVKNLAIVEDLRMDFGMGLNVITGETGAGKSIIVGALGLVLGERADRSMIRTGEDRCGVEAIFRMADPAAVDELLEEMGIAACEDDCLIVRRIIHANGSGKNIINDCPATVQALKRIGDVLVDMHGPHDHQSLLDVSFQLDLLDSFGHLWKSRNAYELSYASVRELEEQRRALDGDDQAVAQQIDMLQFQIKEISEAELDKSDEEEIEQEHGTVANAQRILELATGARDALTEDDGSAFNSLAFSQGALSEMAGLFDEAEAWKDEARSIAVQIQELSNSIESATSSIDGDPARLQWLDDRLALLQKLKRKYGGSVPEVVAFLQKAEARLSEMESRGERIAAIESSLATERKVLTERGTVLSAARIKAADALAEAVTDELRDLGFSHGAFSVALEPSDPTAAGMDSIEFGFAPNVGEPTRPLRTIASSGEISRVMLATKSVLAAHDRIPVLVFDEVDANVGGEMGHAIGQKLSAVSETHQVLCITHLPQVAVHGQAHFVVSKSVMEGRTYTRVTPVADELRVAEIARMLGGEKITSVVLRHAEEMLASQK